MVRTIRCRNCGKVIIDQGTRKPRVYCNANCRNEWYKKKRAMQRKRASRKCLNCGKPVSGSHSWCDARCYREWFDKRSRQIKGEAARAGEHVDLPLAPDEWISVAGAARLLGLSREGIHYHINAGNINSARLAYDKPAIIVVVDSLLQYAEKRVQWLEKLNRRKEAEELSARVAAFQYETSAAMSEVGAGG